MPGSAAPDTTPPTITIATPQDGSMYVLGQIVTADYSCADEDGGSGLAFCAGTVPAGAPIDTATVGQHNVTVTAIDNAGKTASKTVEYEVGYAICASGGTSGPHPAGNNLPIRVDLCDARGDNVGSAAVTVTAVRVSAPDGAIYPARASGRANPQNVFRYDDVMRQYIYDQLVFSVAGDPEPHQVPFTLR